MNIAFVADTHDHLRVFSKCIDYLNTRQIDLLVHCGDWDMPFSMRPLAKAKFPIKAVLGNGDPDIQKFLYQLQNLDALKNVAIDVQIEMQDFTVDNKRICVFHGDDPQVINLVQESQLYDVFCVGHDHNYNIKKVGKTLVINPGSFVGYKYETGNQPIYTVIYNSLTGETETVDLEKI